MHKLPPPAIKFQRKSEISLLGVKKFESCLNVQGHLEVR